VVDATARERIAALVEEGDRLQFVDPRFRAELAHWVRSQALGARDGLSARSFGVPDALSPLVALAIRYLNVGASVGAKDRRLVAASPVIMALATGADSPCEWLATGRALARLLLAATDAGVRAAFMNPPIKVATLRPRLRDAMGLAGIPQLLLRLGRAAEIRPAARRGVEEVLSL
jgi:hypothetical protein